MGKNMADMYTSFALKMLQAIFPKEKHNGAGQTLLF
jgi:hypothetical protein